MRQIALPALAAFAAISLTAPADAAGSRYRMVSSHWWEGSSPACNSHIEVEYEGTELTGTLRWREGSTGWRAGRVDDVVPGFGRFLIGSVDETTSVQGTIDGDTIHGSVTFYQRKCDYRFVLKRL